MKSKIFTALTEVIRCPRAGLAYKINFTKVANDVLSLQLQENEPMSRHEEERG